MATASPWTARPSAAHAYVTGDTGSTFPTKNPLQAFGGNGDAFVTKIDVGLATTAMLSSSLNPSTYGQPVILTAVVTTGDGPPPDGETVTFLYGKKVLGTGTLSGGSVRFSTSAMPVCPSDFAFPRNVPEN
jgi:hypothetical protein